MLIFGIFWEKFCSITLSFFDFVSGFRLFVCSWDYFVCEKGLLKLNFSILIMQLFCVKIRAMLLPFDIFR